MYSESAQRKQKVRYFVKKMAMAIFSPFLQFIILNVFHVLFVTRNVLLHTFFPSLSPLLYVNTEAQCCRGSGAYANTSIRLNSPKSISWQYRFFWTCGFCSSYYCSCTSAVNMPTFYTSSRRAPGSLAGSPTGCSSGTGFSPGTPNSTCPLGVPFKCLSSAISKASEEDSRAGSWVLGSHVHMVSWWT